MAASWTYTGDDGLSSHLAAIAFAAADGVEISVSEQSDDDVALTNPGGFEYEEEFVCPELTSGVLFFSFVCSGADIAVEDFNFEYGGIVGQYTAVVVQATELDCLHVTGYFLLGDSNELANNDFFLAVFGLGGATVVSGALDLLFVDGLSQVAPTLYAAGVVDVLTSPLSVVTAEEPFIFTAGAAAFLGDVEVLASTGDGYVQGAAQTGSGSITQAIAWWFDDCDTSYNCECETDPNAKTLLELRVRLLRRAGYASQATNPPPGVKELFNDYLYSAQEYLYRRYKALQTERMFSWELEPGIRYYGLGDNLQCCGVTLDRSRIKGAWVQDPGNFWYPLVYGIDPTFYTLDQNLGWPNFYQVRQCIEVFPAVSGEGYKLWILGNFGLLPLVEDTDVTTIDADPVFNWALGLAKSHKGDRDAGSMTAGKETGYFGLAIRQIKDYIAAGHGTRRYVPGATQLPVPTPPVMVQFDN